MTSRPLVVQPPRTMRGQLTVPGDKSISHRAIILNSIAQGAARVTNFLAGADCLATLDCMRALGIDFLIPSAGEGALHVRGGGLHGLGEPEDVLDARNSGTTMRLLAGLLAAQPFLSILTGDASLRSRPMGRVVQPLRLMGAEIRGRKGDTLPPLALRGQHLSGIEYSLPVASAQLKSALLLAGLYAEGQTTLLEPAPSRDHTERMLRAMGADITLEERRITIRPPRQPLAPLDLQIPGDLSSAAFWLVAGVLHPQARIEVTGVGINPSRTGVLDVLSAMGAHLRLEKERLEGGEPVADLVVESSELVGTEIGGDLIPRVIDEIPVLAVAASLAKGSTVIRDAAELRVKESDRITTTVQELSRLGARIEELPDGMHIQGVPRLKGALCDSHQDHRLAMALGVAGLVAEGETTIQGAEAVEVSYPGFWHDLKRLAA